MVGLLLVLSSLAHAQVEHVEVRTSNLGLTLSSEVYRLVARRLAPAGGAAAAGAG